MTGTSNKRILLADDSGTVRQLLKLILKKHFACDITEAVDGREAALRVGGESYDLLITDINMPNMDGLSLIRKVRGELSQRVPIIIITTMGGESDRDKGLELGADSYITKPINGHIFVKEVMALLAWGSDLP